MNSDMIERYIYAVTGRMPRKLGKDVAQELRGLIDDMLKERCGEVLLGDKDVRVVLTELGTPNELYEKYIGGGKGCLIGQPYYTTYIQVLKIVIACTVFGMTLATLIALLTEGNGGEGGIPYVVFGIGQWIGNLFFGVAFAFGAVTALFAFFYHKGISLDNYTSPDNLPPVPVKKAQISKTECIFGIGISVIVLIVFLWAPQIFCAVLQRNGIVEVIPIFNVETIRQTWYIIIVFGLLGIGREIVKLIEGKYTGRVVLTAVVTDVLSAVCSVWWLTRRNLINPEFISKMDILFEGDGVFIVKVFAHFQYFFLGVILFALVLDVGTILVRWRKYSTE